MCAELNRVYREFLIVKEKKMFNLKKIGLMVAALGIFAVPAVAAAPVVGQPAPDFEAVDAHGKAFKLSDLKGKNVVLEWTNHQCPFVLKHYESGNMQKVQKKAVDDGAVWVSIISSAPGRQGHVSDAEALKISAERGAYPTTIIRDESGTIGHLYEAKTTPHMFVINAEGVLVYAGAIDSNSSPRAATIEGATNYVVAALDDLKAGNAVGTAQSAPYGCSVKY